jgi:penicillin-binding protein 2
LLSAAGLEEKLITPRTTVRSTGGITIGRESFPDWQPGGHGVTDLNKALAESVNTYFYVLGGGDQQRAGLGVDRMVDYLGRFGWGQRLGIDLPGEVSGLLPTSEWRRSHRLTPWRLGDTYHLAIGQGDLQVTPLQVAAATSVIANGGRLYRPRLVQSLRSADGTLVQNIKPDVINERVVSATNLAAIRTAMHHGVLDGSSRGLQSLPVSAGAKTGTAQYGRDGRTHAWFTAFAPYEHPEVVIAVIIEGGGEGHEAALPIARDILEWYFTLRS